ncbi:DNA polymerase III subunit gamma/tau [Caniella muris]|uniref:DNA polymerase III subunit gamma/tau n=1 Tax=Caniella muris TaxID=2941502 RepID=UPI00203C380B|nr:DNA polymerase III subunit gamma/tau [Caniella muris]
MESLYRKYRPQTFDDVVGQKTVVSTLERGVQSGGLGHAYLFCGPRGTGKTTLARILAKAVACDQGAGHLPDGTCEQCVAIAEGHHPDVHELDAASRTGVDAIREEIVNRVDFAPTVARQKVYIVDEVHMLTTAAFNALLKTLEEPPAHVVFVLCTTDPQKIPATILSRVQRFDFRSIDDADIRERLEYVCREEGFSAEPEAIDIVARHARGGMRDALSTLEQLSVFGDGSITAADARDLLGVADSAALDAAVAALASRDAAALLGLVADQTSAGNDLLRFCDGLVGRLRDLYVAAVAGPVESLLGGTEEERAALAAQARTLESAERISRYLDCLGSTALSMRTARNPRLTLEVAVSRLVRPETDMTVEALAERVAVLERALAGGAGAAPVQVAAPALGAGDGRSQAPAAAERNAAPQRAAAPQVAPAAEREARPASAAAAAAVPPRQPQAQAPQPAAQAAKPASASAPTPAPKPAPQPTPAPKPPAPAPTPAPAPKPAPAAPAPSATSTPGDPRLGAAWDTVLSVLRQTSAPTHALLMNARPLSDDGHTLVIESPQAGFVQGLLGRPDVSQAVSQALSQAMGQRTVEVRAAGAPVGPAQGSPATAAPAPASRPVPQPSSRPTAPQVAPAPQASAPAARPATPQPASQAPSSASAPGASVPPWEEASAATATAVAPPESDDDWVPLEAYGMAPTAGAAEQPDGPAGQPAPASAPKPASAPAPVSASAAPQPAPAPNPAAPAPQPAPPGLTDPFAEAASQAAARPQAVDPSTLPPDQASAFELASSVFGEGVRVLPVEGDGPFGA